MLILGIESSCDETAAAVVENGHKALSDVISSQVEIHARYGGIVPEVASRQHLLEISPVIQKALDQAEITLDDIDAVAVTRGPGLIGALMVGINMAKSIAYSRDLPLIGIHHLEGHTYAAWLEYSDPAIDPGFPLIVLIASGAHTDLILMEGHGKYEFLGRTRDDASGEAFDKAARVLNLGFPGGPAIQKISENVVPTFKFPRAWLKGSYDFSFSGLKTAVLHKAQDSLIYPYSEDTYDLQKVSEIAAAFQESVVDVISYKAAEAVAKYHAKGLILGGGVSANTPLRIACKERSSAPVLIPSPKLCTDNGSMIATVAYYRLMNGETHDLDMDANPNLSLE
ncbi:MAG TPA: tRNA (adenosine(37)-N6)-threonylcarbamoyltransferase complex transferase subunit TsaD [Dehalococcoidia bacterium]|nr:tRNA (adenosine(37)-N6)-threonylcarbamoyltransferase complex transferase subunit TsaD [Dehalococcoidia bacterium]|tara:strand:+ start:3326 stop:4345 length:1020 start_codon:yes stop_codon:yes gene_type:complete